MISKHQRSDSHETNKTCSKILMSYFLIYFEPFTSEIENIACITLDEKTKSDHNSVWGFLRTVHSTEKEDASINCISDSQINLTRLDDFSETNLSLLYIYIFMLISEIYFSQYCKIAWYKKLAHGDIVWIDTATRWTDSIMMIYHSCYPDH